MGICEVLIPLTDSASSEVQGNSAAALGNLSSKGGVTIPSVVYDISCLPLDGRTTSDDYSAFNEVWDKPEGGMHKYLYRFLTSPDATFQHIAVWTIVQLLESGGTSMSISCGIISSYFLLQILNFNPIFATRLSLFLTSDNSLSAAPLPVSLPFMAHLIRKARNIRTLRPTMATVRARSLCSPVGSSKLSKTMVPSHLAPLLHSSSLDHC